jgi:hypothetical protein
MLDDEEVILQQLNKLCGGQNVFSYTRVLKRRMPVEVVPSVTVQGLEVIGEGMGINRKASVKSKIVAHFIKGRISLSSMETILMILGKLEHFESLVKLARRRRDSEAGENQISMVSAPTAVWRICINNTHRSKTLHLLVGDINDVNS